MSEKEIPPDSGQRKKAVDCSLEFHHICVIASDYEEAVRFYVDYMGFEIFRESYSTNKNAKKLELYSGGRYIAELFIKEAGTGRKQERAADTVVPGFNHLSFLTEDVEYMVERMAGNNVPVTEVKTDRITGKKYAFCWDPEGTKIEFYER